MRIRLSKRQGITAFAAALILVAFLILPWSPLILLVAYQTPEYVVQFAKVYTTRGNNGGYDFQEVYCSILLTAYGPISAFNPMTASIVMILPTIIPTLQTLLNFSRIQVFLAYALPFPYGSTNYLSSYAIVNLHPATQNSWSGSERIVYPESGNFDMSAVFENATGGVLREAIYPNIITIASSEVTFSYVTSLIFVSLELVIVGLMVYEAGRYIGSYKEERYSKTDP